MKKILITGVAGLLGSNLAYLLKDRYCIAGIDIKDIDFKSIEYFNRNLLDYVSLKSTINEFKPDIIIHTAAAVNVDQCEKEPEFAEKLNHDLTKEIVSICRDNNILLIYISTDAVFDGKLDKLYTENDITNPLNVYGETKLLGEYEVKQYPNSIILRTNIYGFNLLNKNSFGEWIVKSLRNNEVLNMFYNISFSPILVNNLAEIIHLCIINDIKGIYHACATGKISKYDFGIKIKEIFGIKKGSINCVNSDCSSLIAQRSEHMEMSNEKLSALLKIKIPNPIESIQLFKELEEKDYNTKLRSEL